MAHSETGVVVSSRLIADDRNYETVVRTDRSGVLVTVRFPEQKRKGAAVRVKV